MCKELYKAIRDGNVIHRDLNSVLCNGCSKVVDMGNIPVVLNEMASVRWVYNGSGKNESYICHSWSNINETKCPNCGERGWWLFELCPEKNEGSNGLPIVIESENGR